MRFSSSLKNNFEFRRLYSKGKSVATPFVVVYCRKNGRDCNRVGITVGTKLGKAVARNRMRRRLREVYRLNEEKLVRGMDIVLVARGRSRYADFKELTAAYLQACGRLSLLKVDKKGAR